MISGAWLKLLNEKDVLNPQKFLNKQNKNVSVWFLQQTDAQTPLCLSLKKSNWNIIKLFFSQILILIFKNDTFVKQNISEIYIHKYNKKIKLFLQTDTK